MYLREMVHLTQNKPESKYCTSDLMHFSQAHTLSRNPASGAVRDARQHRLHLGGPAPWGLFTTWFTEETTR